MKAALAAALGIALMVAIVRGQPPTTQLPKGQMPDLGRPTKVDDQLPPFDFDAYFPGKWSFEWDVPEGPLGPAGRITGTTVYKLVDGRFYEANSEATGPGGAFKLRELIAYHKEYKALSRYVTDSRGFTYLQIGTIGGDLGGYYTIFWETQPVKKNGKTVKLKGKTLMLSPANYRLQVQISVDVGPYTNFGNPWFRKTENN